MGFERFFGGKNNKPGKEAPQSDGPEDPSRRAFLRRAGETVAVVAAASVLSSIPMGDAEAGEAVPEAKEKIKHNLDKAKAFGDKVLKAAELMNSAVDDDGHPLTAELKDNLVNFLRQLKEPDTYDLKNFAFNEYANSLTSVPHLVDLYSSESSSPTDYRTHQRLIEDFMKYHLGLLKRWKILAPLTTEGEQILAEIENNNPNF